MSVEVDARLDELIAELAADPKGGRKFHRKVTLDEAARIAARVHAEVDRGVAARDELLAGQGKKLACGRGCCGCCEEPIMGYRPEAARVARWLEQPENTEARAHFLASYPIWRARFGDTLVRLAATFANNPSAYRDAHVAAWAKGVPCAFLRDGACTVYPVRPVACRTAHALDTAEFCNGAATESATRATFVPLDQFVAKTRTLLAAAHHAARGPSGRIEPLCDVVYELLPPALRQP